MKHAYVYDTNIGKILVKDEDNYITNVEIINSEYIIPTNIEFIETDLIKNTYTQLNEYFNKERTCFNIPTKPTGTIFQQKVWKELCNIPYGKTKTYGEIAKLIGNEKASRAVGMANHNNPILIIIPCHRVIGANRKSNWFWLWNRY